MQDQDKKALQRAAAIESQEQQETALAPKSKSGEFYKFTTTKPVGILMFVIGIVVFGWISYAQLPLNLMPDITYPSVTVRTEYTGTAPEEIETAISRPIEQALGVVNKLVSINSISKAGQSDVKLEFTWDADMNQATADVREKLDQVFLPEDAERPLILRYDPSLDPIIRVGLYGAPAASGLFRMRYIAEEEIKRKLERLPGVAAVKVKGGLEEEIRVELNEQQLTLIGIDIQQVKNRLAQENVNLAGGNLKEGETEYLVRTLNEFKTVAEISEVVIGIWNNREIKIKDVAKVTRTNRKREIVTRIDGQESVEIEIFKEADANIVEVAKRVTDRILGTPEQEEYVLEMEAQKQDTTKSREMTNGSAESTNGHSGGNDAANKRRMTNFIAYELYELSKDLNIVLLSDQSVFIENSIADVKTTAVVGGLLAIIVLFVFLRNFTATLIIGISIPISIIATFAPMKIFDVSLNIMSLGGLALGIGMLVDNSIVVLESIARCREEGDGLIQATMRGVSEVGSAVFASTLTTVAVFFPIVFVEGVAGQIFGDMALTVVFSLLASLAVALFLIPMLSSRSLGSFAGGATVKDFMQGSVFSFSSEKHIREAFDKSNGLNPFSRLGKGAWAFVANFGIIVFKIVQALAAFVIALLKVISLPIVLLATPILGLGKLLRLVKFNISGKFGAYSQSQKAIWQFKFVQSIWPPFLSYKCLYECYDDFRKFKASFRESSIVKKIVRAIFAPVVFTLYFVKFIVHFFLEAIFRVFHLVITSVMLLLKFSWLQLQLLFTIPAAIVFAVFNVIIGAIEKGYPKLLQGALQNRVAVLGGMAAVFVFSIFVIWPRLGSELIPEVNQGEFNVEVSLPVGTPVERTDARIGEIQDHIQAMAGVGMIAAVSGTDKSASAASEEGEHTAKLTVMVDREQTAVDEDGLIAAIRDQMKDYSGIQWKIALPVLFSFKTPIELEIHGYNLTELKQTAQNLEEELRQIPGLFDVKSSMQAGNPEVQIIYNRDRLALYGLNVRNVASIVRNKVRGDVATEFKQQDRRIDILVQLRESDRQSIENLGRLIVNPGSGKPIPLSAVADLRVNEGPSEIRRVDQQRTALITANISGRDLGGVSSDIHALMNATDLPDGFTYTLAGQNKEMETSMNSLMLALALAVFLVYIVMASQFESLVHPFIIIFTIPLAIIGVVAFLYLLDIPLSIVVFLGMIMLAGIVVNNAIVLVDYINQLRERGMEKMQAIIEAGRVRLRPILMTTLTTVLGLLPMAIGFGDGAEIRTPMAITVIFGLLTATILTLVVIPTMYSLVDRKS